MLVKRQKNGDNIMSKRKDKEKDEFWWLVLFTLFELEQETWNQLINKERSSTTVEQQEYKQYFNKVFESGIPSLSLKPDISLYRARQIKSSEISQLGVNEFDIIEKYLKVFLTDKKMQMFKNLCNEEGAGSNIQLQLLLVLIGMRKITKEQQRKINKIIKEYSSSKVYGFSEHGSRVPPEKLRKAGRLNTTEDPYLYLSFEKDTAIYEMRPSIGQKYSLAEFKINKNIKMADLSEETLKHFQNNFSLFSLASKISEPNTDNSDLFYHITQNMAHSLQDRGYNGIIYSSSMKKGAKNVLLFNETNVDFISSEIISINNINIDYSNIFPLCYE